MTSERTSIVNSYYDKNYNKLCGIARKILNKANRLDLDSTLVNESYMYVIESMNKVGDLIDSGKVEAVVVQYMYKSIGWNNSKFYTTYINDKREQTVEFDFNKHTTEIDDEEEMLEREFEHQNQIAHIRGRHAMLDMPSRVLYDLAIVGPYNSSGKLTEYININRTTTYVMMRDLKNFLREGYESKLEQD